jgi:hypothetical protein
MASSLPQVFTASMNFLELGILLTASKLLRGKPESAAAAIDLGVREL